MNDLILIESQSARTETLINVTDDRAVECLNKAKALTMALWQGRGAATTKQMAEYYEILEDTVQTFARTNRDELLSDGLKIVKGKELKDVVLTLNTTSDKTPSLTIWTPRAALRLGLLLRDSPIAKAVRTEMLDIVESKPVHDLQTVLDASAVIIEEVERLREENNHLKRVSIDLTEIKYKLDTLIHASRASKPTPKALKSTQNELPLDIEQRYKESQAALLAAKTLENEAKAKALTNKFAPKAKPDIDNLIATDSVAAWLNESVVLDPKAKTYVGKATGNPDTHLYPNYVTYCKQHRLELINIQRFSRHLMSLVEMTLEVKLGKGKDGVGCHVKGVAIGEAKNLLMAGR